MFITEVKEEIHSLLPIGRHVFSRLQKRRASLTVSWEEICDNSEWPYPPPSTPSYTHF